MSDKATVKRVACWKAIRDGIRYPWVEQSITGSAVHSGILIGHQDAVGQGAAGHFSADVVVTCNGGRVEVRVDKLLITVRGGTAGGVKLVWSHIEALYKDHLQKIKSREAEQALWDKRQKEEIGDLEYPKTVVPEIIREGNLRGRYKVRLEPGNPLENLTLAELRMILGALQMCI